MNYYGLWLSEKESKIDSVEWKVSASTRQAKERNLRKLRCCESTFARQKEYLEDMSETERNGRCFYSLLTSMTIGRGVL